MIKRKLLTISIIMLVTALAAAADALPKEQITTLFSQANGAFRQANAATDDPGKANSLYEKAILGYEKIISDSHIENPKLYYNLANAYLLQNDLGRAILNYRKAEKLDKTNSDIQKNLAFARARRIDKVEQKTETQIMQTLIFWHYDLGMQTKFIIACISFAIFCFTLAATIWFGRKAGLLVVALISAVLLICFAGSLVVDSYNQATQSSGVIVSKEVTAYQGDGPNYPASFKEPLHAGTEFILLERRPGWFHIRLANGSDGWIPQPDAELI
jgi:tetratricopeptide (TPR) repeat protein